MTYPKGILDALDYISTHKSEIGTWRDCARLYTEQTDELINAEALRKRISALRVEQGLDHDDAFYRFEKEKIQYRDERNARNAAVRRDARIDHKFDLLAARLGEISRREFPPKPSPQIKRGTKSIVVMLSDWHIGLHYDNIFGHYDADTAADRINRLLREVYSIQRDTGADEVHLVLLGDMISGNIHKSIQVTNREHVIDQIKTASELVMSVIYDLLDNFRKIVVTSCPGNHTRIDRKDDALNDERLDDLITWAAQLVFRDHKRVVFTDKIDCTFALVEIRGCTYYAVHGDFDGYTRAAADHLVSITGQKPEAILYGHLHTPAYADESGIKLIRSGCLSGSGDEYTIRKRLSGRPCQVVLVCGEDGVEDFRPVYLD